MCLETTEFFEIRTISRTRKLQLLSPRSRNFCSTLPARAFYDPGMASDLPTNLYKLEFITKQSQLTQDGLEDPRLRGVVGPRTLFFS